MSEEDTVLQVDISVVFSLLTKVLGRDSNGTNDTNATRCGKNDPTLQNTLGLFVSWTLSVVIIIILVIAQKRTRLCVDRCYGRPGLPIPLDFVVTPRNRLIYTILFSVMGTALISGYGNFGSTLSFHFGNIYASLFNRILLSPLISVVTLVLEYFPLFATVEFPIPILGYGIGCFYSIVWFLTISVPRVLYYRMLAETCDLTDPGGRATVAVAILQDAPFMLLSVYIVLWFLFKIGRSCFWKPFHRKKRKVEQLGAPRSWKLGIRPYHLEKVKTLLTKPPPKKKLLEKTSNPVLSMVEYLLPFDRHFRLPLPLLGAIVAMVMIIYQVSLSVISKTFITLSMLQPVYDDGIKPLFDDLSMTVPDEYQESVIAAGDILASLFIGLPAIVATAPFLSVFLSSFLLFHLVASISKELKSAEKRGFKGRLPKRYRRLAGFWKYIGLQIGLFVTAWSIYTVIFVLIGVLLMALTFVLKHPFSRKWFFNILLGIIVPLVWAKTVFVLQTLICKYLFLEDKGRENSKFIPIRHRRLYNWFSFALFFYNGIAGLVGAVVRITFSTFFSLLLIFRLDVVSLPPNLWWWDFGHRAFLGFVYLDYCYNHPVLHVFSHLLENAVREKAVKESDDEVKLVEANLEGSFVPKSNKSRLLRNRWLVAYTLLRNPCLRQLTAKNLRKEGGGGGILSEEDSEKESEELELDFLRNGFEEPGVRFNGVEYKKCQ